MAKQPPESERDVGKEETSVLDEQLRSEIFAALWGHEREALPTVVDYAYEQIWKQLVFVYQQKEQRLSDVTLAETLGISRTPVRQALERLVKDGLVRADPRRGFWVRQFTIQDIHEIYDLRGALEVLALRLAIPHLDPAGLREQLGILAHIRALLEQGQNTIAQFMPCDFRLHTLLIRASGNGRLIDYLSTLRSQFSVFQIQDAWRPQRVQSALDDHEQILQALLENDGEKATEKLAEHIARSKTYVLADLFASSSTNP